MAFPTIVGQRSSAIEATAIWSAEQFLKTTQPGVALRGCEVDARQLTVVVWLPARDCVRVKVGQAAEVAANSLSAAPPATSGDDDEEVSTDDAPLPFHPSIVFRGVTRLPMVLEPA